LTSFRGLADHSRVFIRRTQTRRAKDGSAYTTHRLVRSERRGGKVRQRTLLNLGRHFEIGADAWPRLCARIGDLLDGQPGLLDDVPEAIEAEAQRIAALLLARGVGEAPGLEGDAVAVHPDSMELARPRGVGVEQVGLWAMEQVGLMPLLEELGVNGALRAAAAGLIVGRLAHPGSERETHRWLRRDSALGELLGGTVNVIIARLFGRRIVRRFVGAAAMSRVDGFYERHLNDWKSLLAARVLLFSVYDFISYAVGFSQIRLSVYIAVSFLGGLIPTLLFVLIGSEASQNQNVLLLFYLLAAIAFFVLVLFRAPISRMMKQYGRQVQE